MLLFYADWSIVPNVQILCDYFIKPEAEGGKRNSTDENLDQMIYCKLQIEPDK